MVLRGAPAGGRPGRLDLERPADLQHLGQLGVGDPAGDGAGQLAGADHERAGALPSLEQPAWTRASTASRSVLRPTPSAAARSGSGGIRVPDDPLSGDDLSAELLDHLRYQRAALRRSQWHRLQLLTKVIL